MVIVVRETYEISGLNETKEEPSHNQSSKVLRTSCGRRDDTPKNHCTGEIDGGLSELVQHQVGWNYNG